MKERLENRGLELALFFALAMLACLLVYDKMIIFSIVALVAVAVFVLAEGYRIHTEDRSIIYILAIGALLLRIAFIILTQAFDNPFLRADGITYGHIGNEIARTWQAGDSYIINKANYGYYYFNALIFYATGYYPDVVRIINGIIAIGAALNLYFISLNLSGRRAAKLTFALTAFFPSFIVWSALNLKESLCVFLITYIVKKVIEIIQEFRFTKLIAIALALLPLVTLRFYVGILLGVVMALTYLFSAVNFTWNKRIIYTLILVLVVGVSLSQMGYGFLGKDYLASQSLDTIGEQHNAGAIGDAAYSKGVDFSSPLKALLYLPLGLFYFAFGPLPWQSGGLLKIISLPEMFMLYLLYLFVWSGIYSLWRHRRGECIFLLILIASFTLIYALGGSNMGGIYRVRFQVLSLLFIFISHGLAGKLQQSTISPKLSQRGK